MAALASGEWAREGLHRLQAARGAANAQLAALEPLQLALASALAALLLASLLRLAGDAAASVEKHGLKGLISALLFKLLKFLPRVDSYIQKEKKKTIDQLRASVGRPQSERLSHLPKVGLKDGVLGLLKDIHAKDKQWQGKCSGTVYMGGRDFEQHVERVTTAYRLFSHTNPIHPGLFPSVVQFESEVVAITGSLLGAQSKAAGGQVCGSMTSGGSESILMAVKAARDCLRAARGIVNPEMVIAESAHSAYDKAAEYFGVRLRRARVGSDYRADVQAMGRLVNRNTIMIVGSAPGYPHGVIDPIEELGALALKKGICFHVDLCLGGFVLPFARLLGYSIPPFDFEVPGVTSISVDTHKYGLGPKGSSVVLYRNHELRRHQFVAVTEWSGGLYVSPSAAGSRPGGLIAAAWAALVSTGEDGFLEITRAIMGAAKAIIEGIEKIDGLYVLGKPHMTVVAFGSNEVDIYKVNDVMASKGWSLSALQRPASVHMCVTLQHVDSVQPFLADLEAAVCTVREAGPGALKGGLAPIYGAAATMPDRGTVRDLLLDYMDAAA